MSLIACPNHTGCKLICGRFSEITVSNTSLHHHLFREKICCGTIFRGPFGETVVDVSFLTPCSGRQTGSNGLRCLTSEMEAAKRLSEEVASAAAQHVDVATATKVAAAGDAADDEGFFDKNVASPSESSLSARSDVCSGASESGTTSPPPNVEEEEEEEEEEEMMEEVSSGFFIFPINSNIP